MLDLYRDKPAAQGGKLYGLPPDSNCQLQFYRVDIFDKAGIKPALTWDDAIENAKVLSDGGKKKVVGAPLKRGFWAAHVFITMLRSYGGDWFDKMEAGGWKVGIDTDEGRKAMDTLMRLVPYLEPTSLNASDDEANTAMLNGTWVYAPVEWGGSSMNDPKYTKFADVWKVGIVPKGTGPKARHAPHMGGLGFIVPTFSQEQGCRLGVDQVLLQRRQPGSRDRQGLGRECGPAGARVAPEEIHQHPAVLFRPAGIAACRHALPADPRIRTRSTSSSAREVASVVTGQKPPAQGLKDMQAAGDAHHDQERLLQDLTETGRRRLDAAPALRQRESRCKCNPWPRRCRRLDGGNANAG